MQENREQPFDNPLRHLTEAQFMALGGNAVVYVKHVKGADIGPILPQAEAQFDRETDFHIVVSADGSPLMVGDTEEAVEEWLAERSFGIVTLH
jgi:hypothetical protein